MSTENYTIGYKKPPEESQFRPGKSGNPRGRPKASKNTYSILDGELSKIILLKENGKEIKLTKKQAMLRHLINKAVQGDSKAMFFVFNQLLELDQKSDLKSEASKMLADEDQAILKQFLESNIKNYSNPTKLSETTVNDNFNINLNLKSND